MDLPPPWLTIGSATALLALCLLLALKLISPKRFAQIFAGLASGVAIGLALSRLPAGGAHG